MSLTSEVTVVIPVTNDRHYLKDFLPSLKNIPSFCTIAFYVNSSQDGSIDVINEYAENRPEVAVHVTDGYTASAYNHAMRTYDTPYFLLLQPSIKPHQDMLDLMLSTLEIDESVAGVGPLILKENGLCSGAGLIFSRAHARDADHDKPPTEPRLMQGQEFIAMRDRCLLIRRIGLFADLYKNSHHDIDWGLEASADGYKFYFEPLARATDISVPMHNQFTDSNANLLMYRQKGLEGLDKRNNAGQYYGSGFSYPAIETWQRKEEPRHARIVCFLADWEGCGSYRILNPYRMMVINGFEVMFTMYMIDEFIEWGDVCILQRQCSAKTLEQAKKIRAAGKPLIYEIDDFFHGLHSKNPVVHNFIQNPEELRNMEEIIHLSNALVVSTPELARQYGRFNTNTNIVPNYIDLGRIPTIKMGDGKTIRIGWGGSATHDADMMIVTNVLHKIVKEFPQVTLVFLGADYRPYFPELPADRMEWFPSTFEHEDPVGDYYQVLNDACLDIGLAPLEDTLFNRCKSDIKLVEYGAFGICAVASDVEPYSLFAKEAAGELTKGVFLAKTERDWEKYLRRLITEPGLLNSMSRQVQKYVWENRSVANMADGIEQVVAGVLAGYGHNPRSVQQINPDGSEVEVFQPPVHSLNVPYLNNQTSKQATEYMKRHRAQAQLPAAS